MSTEVSALGLSVEATSVTRATRELVEFAGASTRAADASETLEQAAGDTEDQARSYSREASKASSETRKLGEESRQASQAQLAMASGLGTVVGRLIAAAGAYLGLREVLGRADEWSDMSSRIGIAIRDMDGAAGMMAEMTRLARASYSPLAQTVEVFTENSLALRDLGYSTAAQIDYTESLNNALVITATRGDRAVSVQRALSTAMAIGTLQGDGLNTVLSNGSRIAEALASELGTTVSGLRGMASQGRITGEVIARSLIDRVQELRDQAAEMPATLSDGFTLLGNALTAAIGRLDQATGVTATLAEWIINLSDGLLALSDYDFGGVMSTMADGVTLLSQAILVLAATRLPALVVSLAGVNLGASLMTAQFIAGAVASRALTIAMSAQAVMSRGLAAAMALAGGPVGILSAATVGLGLALYNTRRNAEATRATLVSLAVAQRGMTSAWDEFYRTMSNQSLDLLRQSAQAQVDAAQAALESAQDELGRASNRQFLLFGFGESGRMAEARAAVEDLTAALAEAEAELSAVEHRSRTMAESNVEAVNTLTQSQQSALSRAQELERTMRQRVELLQTEARWGQESIGYQITTLEHEREIFNARLAAMDVSESTRQTLRELWQETVELEGRTNAWEAATRRVEEATIDSYRALRTLRESEPDQGFLATAISRARDLATAFHEALAASNSIQGMSLDDAGNPTTLSRSQRPNPRPIDWLPGDGSSSDRGGGGGGGGSNDRQTRIEALITEIATERETLTLWYQERLELLQSSSDAELEAVGGRLEAIERLETEHQARLREMRDRERSYEVEAQSGVYSALSSLLSTFGSRSRAAGLAALAINTAMRIRETLQNTAAASVRALAELGPIAGPPVAAKISAYGYAQAALIAAQGVASAVGSKGGGGSAGGGGGLLGGSNEDSSSSSSNPLRVSVDAFDPGSLYSGEAIRRVFEALQKEAGNRGIIWVPTG